MIYKPALSELEVQQLYNTQHKTAREPRALPKKPVIILELKASHSTL
jgi:hypothetical protein